MLSFNIVYSTKYVSIKLKDIHPTYHLIKRFSIYCYKTGTVFNLLYSLTKQMYSHQYFMVWLLHTYIETCSISCWWIFHVFDKVVLNRCIPLSTCIKSVIRWKLTQRLLLNISLLDAYKMPYVILTKTFH